MKYLTLPLTPSLSISRRIAGAIARTMEREEERGDSKHGGQPWLVLWKDQGERVKHLKHCLLPPLHRPDHRVSGTAG